MVRFIARRLGWGLVSILILATVAFFGVNILLPYTYASQFALEDLTGALELREALGLNRPLVVQWLDYMGGLVRGDLGTGFDEQAVTSHVLRAVPVTALLFAAAGMVAYMLGDWVGRVIAWQKSKLVSGGATTVSVLLYTIFPVWLIFLLGRWGMDWLQDLRVRFDLPFAAYGPLPQGEATQVFAFSLLLGLMVTIFVQWRARRTGIRLLGLLAFPFAMAGVAAGLVLLEVGPQALDMVLRPSFVFAVAALVLMAYGEVMLVMRTGTTLETTEDYVRTARAKGVRERFIRDQHVAHNATLPALSRFLASVPYLLTGLIIVESQLSLNGISTVFFNSVENANVPVVVGTLVMTGVVVIALRILLDIVQATLDPRIRITGESS